MFRCEVSGVIKNGAFRAMTMKIAFYAIFPEAHKLLMNNKNSEKTENAIHKIGLVCQVIV
jgi:hypothetical protein